MPKQVKDLINSYTLRKRVVSFGCENLCITETYRNYRHPGICCHCSFRSACSTCSSKVCCNQPLQPVRDIWSRQVRNVMCKLAKYIKIPQCLGWCSQTSGLSLSSFFITTATRVSRYGSKMESANFTDLLMIDLNHSILEVINSKMPCLYFIFLYISMNYVYIYIYI